jgi:pimeloyl-ACP methyl ester carboxylesterase
VKDLQGRIVKGANHFVQQDDPETVNKYIREFLEQSTKENQLILMISQY